MPDVLREDDDRVAILTLNRAEVLNALRPASFEELAAHLENIASNIMAFFLDPAERHGLGPLFLDALFATRASASSSRAENSSEPVSAGTPFMHSKR